MDGRGHGQSMESTKTMWMKAEQGSEICTRNAWEKESLWSISFVKGYTEFLSFVATMMGDMWGTKRTCVVIGERIRMTWL